MDPNLAALDQVRITAIDLGMKFGPKLFVATFILVAGYLAARWIGGGVGRWLDRFEFEPPVRQLMLSLTRVLVCVLFAIMALQNLGVELVPLLAGLGVVGAGIALAMQGVLGNLVAGLTIILTRPFRVGEYISIAREEGEVVEIRLASTTLSHADRSQVVIPNRRIVGEILHNYGRMRQLQVQVGVAYDADLKQAFAAIREVLDSSARVLKDPAPVLGVSSLDDSSIIIGVRPWANVSDFGPAGDEIYRAILEAFRQRGVVIPFPQREVRMLGKAA